MKTINRQKEIVDSKMALNFSPKIWCKIHVHQPSLQLKNYSVLYVIYQQQIHVYIHIHRYIQENWRAVLVPTGEINLTQLG